MPQRGRLARLGHALGPGAGAGGSPIERSRGGQQALALPNGERRTFLEDGATVVLRGHAERDGFVRIGLGEVTGTVLPAPGAS